LTATRVFAEEDQTAFARWSGDWNPMHMDPLAARRTPAGAPVVHGIHLLIWALDQALAEGASFAPPFSVRADFRKFVFVGQQVSMERSLDEDGKLVLRLISSDGVVVSVRIGHANPGSVRPERSSAPVEVSEPQTPTVHQIRAATGSVTLCDAQDFGSAFPGLRDCIADQNLTALARISFLVGMVCPGLHSILAAVALDFVPAGAETGGMAFRTSSLDERFGLVRMEVDGAGIRGSVDAFMRPEPVRSLTMEEASRLIAPQQFVGRRALVVGGSRGLGAVTAKLLAAGGADVTITYASGAAEAAEICREIELYGAGTCAAVQLDVLDDFLSVVATLPAPTHTYYFATPPIFLQKKPDFDRAIFDRFVDFYVDAFDRLCTHFARRTGDTISVLYPSSVAVAERPAGLTEYAMAKAAGETLCENLQRLHSNLHIRVERLPRVLTDQTAKVQPVKSAAAEDIMFPLLIRA
jgi:hypothetical protein